MKFTKLLGIFLLVMLALSVVVELVFRFVAPQPVDPGHEFVLYNEIEGLKPSVEFSIDANHIRGFDSDKKKPDGAVRILCVGGGATGTMLQTEGDTWWGIVGSGLEKSLGKPVEIGCLVTPAASDIIGGAQWTEYLLEHIDGVDLVIATYGHSEVLRPGVDFSFDPSTIKEIEFEDASFMRRVAKSSHLVRLVRNRHVKSKREHHENAMGAPDYIRDRFLQASQSYRSLTMATSAPERKSDPIEAYLHGIGLFIESARRNEVGLLVVGEPTVFSEFPSPDAATTLHSLVQVGVGPRDFARPVPAWVDRELERYYSSGRRLCEAAGVGFVKLHGEVLPSRTNFFTESTLTDAGAREAAEFLLPEIQKTLK